MKQRWSNKLPTNPKKKFLAFVFREISSIVYNFSFCCELRRCRESPICIFLLRFSTNRHIWRILRLLCEFQKFSNFENSDFSVFCYESAHLVTYRTILRISKICKFGKLGFFCISLWIGAFGNFRDYFANFENLPSADFFRVSRQIDTFGNFWDYFANLENLQIWHTSIFLYFLTNYHIWRRLMPLCKFRKFANLANLNFFVFLNKLSHLATFDATLQISKICKFGKLDFFLCFSTNCHIWRRLIPLCKFLKFATISKFF